MVEAMPRKILLATDLTPSADRAYDRAIQLSDEWNAELIVCHVIESSARRPWGIERRMRNAQTELERLVRSTSSVRKVVSQTLVGDPAELMIQHAEAMGCDLLVTGPAQGGGFDDKLLGSTAARMIRRAHIPVLAVRRRPEGPYRTAVAAVDFSDITPFTIARARALFPAASLTVFHAYSVTPDWSGTDAEKSMDEIEAGERNRVRTRAEEDMAAVLGAVGGAGGGQTKAALQEGAPDKALAEFVEKNWPDLVIAGTHGRTGGEAGTIGSVTEQILTTVACDVLAVPPRR